MSALISAWSPILCGVVVFDASQGTLGGALRGIGRPLTGALSGVVSYLVVSARARCAVGAPGAAAVSRSSRTRTSAHPPPQVGTPLSYVLGRVLRIGGGLAGIWAGVGVSVIVSTCIMGGTLLRLDWAAVADEAADAAAKAKEEAGAGARGVEGDGVAAGVEAAIIYAAAVRE